MTRLVSIANKDISSRLFDLRSMLELTREQIERKFNFAAATIKSWECHIPEYIQTNKFNKYLSIFRTLGIVVTDEWVISGTGVAPYFAPEISIRINNVFDLFMDNKILFFVLDPSLIIKKIHPSYANIFSNNIEEIEGRHIRGLLENNNIASSIKAYNEVLKGEKRSLIIELPNSKTLDILCKPLINSSGFVTAIFNYL